MAVSSTSSSSGSSIASIDVASVVDQLMKVENKPLDALNKKIDQQNLVISDLGTIKSKTAIFQDALKDFENSNSYNTVDVSYPDKAVLTATGSNGAILGNFSVTVNTVAKADTWSISGFTATNNSIGVASGGFNITVAGTTYNTVSPPRGVGALGTNPTVTDLANWINSLGVDAVAQVVKTTDSSSYVLQIYGTKTGTANAVTYSGITTGPAITTTPGTSGNAESAAVTFTALNAGQQLTLAGLTFTAGSSGATAIQVASAFGGLSVGGTASALNASKSLGSSAGGTFTTGTVVGWSTSTYSANSALITFTSSTTGDVTNLTGNFLTAAKTTTATDSQITVNSTSFVRSSNVINDVIDGVTLSLFNTSATAQMVNVSRGLDNSETVIKKMIDTYNDLITTYKTMTANSYNSEKPGTFANDPTTLAFINEIKARFAKGITYGTAMTSSLSMASMGIDLQIDGVLKFNALTYLDAQAAGLQDKLAQGVTVGYVNSTNNLKEYIDDLIGITGGGGSLTDVITTEKEQINDLFKRQTLLQDKLIKVQNTLVTQYSALNSLLYQLSVTSNSLTSALDALSNNNKN
jgi:flagellar hook-associated protein 2